MESKFLGFTSKACAPNFPHARVSRVHATCHAEKTCEAACRIPQKEKGIGQMDQLQNEVAETEMLTVNC